MAAKPRQAECTSQELRAAAERLSANAFINALMRETPLADWSDDPHELRLRLPQAGRELHLRARYRSSCSRHQFEWPIRSADGPLEWLQAVEMIAAEPSLFPGTPAESRALFVSRSKASVQNLELALQARAPVLDSLLTRLSDFAAGEQALLSGHSIHPTPKSRDQFDDDDSARYAPEFGQDFRLQWIAVAADRLHGESADGLPAEEHARRLYRQDVPESPAAAPLAVPMHPWQWQRLRHHPQLAAAMGDGRIRELGPGQAGWRATSSLRAVHAAHAGEMLKFSLSLRLTNSIRTLLPKEMQRGLELRRVMRCSAAREFQARFPQFRVMGEPAFLTLIGDDGAALPESLVMFRDNPFRGHEARDCCVLATLTQDHPLGGDALAAQLIRRRAARQGQSTAAAAEHWFDRFLDVAVVPLAYAQADYGLLFGAHQQNLVLRFEDELPAAAWFRDCQGTGYSPTAHRRFAAELPQLGQRSQNLLDTDFGNRLLTYYLIINSALGLIGAIGASGLVDESRLLARLRRRLEQIRDQGVADPSWLDFVLDAPEWKAKGNFRCAFTNINETTTDDPLAVYHPLPNALGPTLSGYPDA